MQYNRVDKYFYSLPVLMLSSDKMEIIAKISLSTSKCTQNEVSFRLPHTVLSLGQDLFRLSDPKGSDPITDQSVL